MKQSEIVDRLTGIDEQLVVLLERALPVGLASDAVASVRVNAENIALIVSEVARQHVQITGILEVLDTHMSAEDLVRLFEEMGFTSRQLLSVLQGTRDDLVLLRTDVRRYAAVGELVLKQRVDDEEEWQRGHPDRRVSSIMDRRQ